MDTSVKRVVVWFIVLLLLVRILPVDAASEAALQFIAAGVLPGTDIAIPVPATFLLLAELTVLSVLLIFRHELNQALLGRREVRALQQQRAAAKPVQPAQKEKPVAAASPVVIVIPGSKGLLPRAFSFIVGHTPRLIRRVAGYLKPRLLLAVFKTLYGAEVARQWLITHTHMLKQQSAESVRWLWQLVRVFAVKFWRVAYPYMRQFDSYLEKQSKQSKAYKYAVKRFKHYQPLMLAWRQELDTIRERLISKS